MKCIRFFFLILILAAVVSLHAQNQSIQVYIVAPKTSFVWGDPNKLTVIVRNGQGQQLPDRSIVWFVDPPGAATISTDGSIVPGRLQIFTARATDAQSGRTAEIALQVIPSKIVVVPERQTMTIGSSQNLRAEALDINDRPIPAATFVWRLQNMAGFWDQNYPMATIDLGGRLTSLVQGSMRALAVIPYASQTWLPTFLSQASGDTQIDIEVKKTYTFERVFASKPEGSSSQLTADPSPLVATEDDGFVFAASLNHITSALVEWKAGTLTPLIIGGRSHSSTRQPLIEFGSYSRNRRGEMLTVERDPQGQPQISFGPAQAQLPLLVPGTPLAVALRTWGFDIQRNSLSDSGYKVVRVNYSDAVTELNNEGLFRGAGRGLEELIVDKITGLPGRSGQNFWFDSYGITNDGVVWFKTNDPSNRQTLWKQSPYGPIEKVLATNDSFQGGSVTYLGLLFVSGNGDVVMPFSTTKTGCYARWSPDVADPQSICGLSAPNDAVLGYAPELGSLIKVNYSNQGTGVYLWNKDGVAPLIRNGENVDGAPVTEIYSATVNSHGVVFAELATSKSSLIVMRIRPDRQVLLREGDTVPIPVSPTISSFIPGRGAGPALVMVGGLTGSIAQLNSDGRVQPLINVGDLLPNGSRYAGSRVDPWGPGQVRSIADGSIVFEDSSGIHRWRNNLVETLYPLPGKIGGIQMGSAWALDANSAGQIAAQVYGSDNGIYRLSNQVATLVVRQIGTLDGEKMTDMSNPAIDDTGRVAFKFQNDQGNWNFVGFWDGTTTRKILWQGMGMPDGRTISWVDRLEASADAFTTRVGMSDNQSTLIRYRNGSWQYVIGKTDQIATGNVVNSLDSPVGLNTAGDVSFIASGQHVEAKRGTVFHEIQDLGQLTDEDEFLLAVANLHLSDNGILYVLATTDQGQQVVYRATPGVAASTAIEAQSFSLTAGGSTSTNTAGRSADLVTGFARVQPDNGMNTPDGLAIFSLRKDGTLITEAGVPAATLIRNGRFFADVDGIVNTGVAIANPSNQVAVVQYFITDETGLTTKSGSITVGAKSHIAQFLDGPLFATTGNVRGTLTFNSSVPVGVTALRGLTNALNNFLITTLPVVDLDSPLQGVQYLPHFAIGNGWTTQVVLVNPTDAPIDGSLAFYSSGNEITPGAPVTLTIGQQSANSFQYSIPAKSMRRYVPAVAADSYVSGTVVVTPKTGAAAPSALAVFSFRNSTTTVTEAGVSGSSPANAFRMYAEVNGDFLAAERNSISTGIAVANGGNAPASVTIELIGANGVSSGLKGSLKVPAHGKVAPFLQQIPGLEKMPSPFSGILRITSDLPVTVLGLRGRRNEVSDFLITTTPAIPEGITTTAERIFPHLADGGGYTTQFILIQAGSNSSSGSLKFFNEQGQPLALRFQN